MKRWFVVITVFSVLLFIILPACGRGGEEKTTTPVVMTTPVPTPTLTATPTPTPEGPVKIGAIQAWSGPMAMSGMLADQIMALIEEQVKNTGGILGGREIKFVKGDDQGTVAGSSGQARKLILDDKVAILTLGGESAAQFTSASDIAEELKMPFVAFATIDLIETKKYSASLYDHELVIARIANFIIDVVKPKTVAYLAYDGWDSHEIIDGVEVVVGARDRWKAKGINIVFEQYFPQDTADFSPYLTKIKYLNPDVVVTELNNLGQAITINKQINELGGWGNIKYFAATEASAAKSAITMPSALGTYVSVLWLPGSDEPGMRVFENAFVQKYNRPPAPDLTYYYNCFWTAIKAIELAGTDDPEKVAEALRSGNLEWDSAWGPMRIETNGIGDVKGTVAQVQEGGKLVKVWP
jgi:ABC-type branched-subunit amino acid transport system substrate-binding protein